MKTIDDVAAIFFEKWDGPKLTFLKNRRALYYEDDGILYFIKFEKIVPLFESPLVVNAIIGFENIRVSMLHSIVMEKKYEKLRYTSWSIQLAFWIYKSELDVCRKALRNTRMKFGHLGWRFRSDDDFESNIKQIVKFAKIAKDELHLKAKDENYLQSLRSLSDDGRSTNDPPLYFLQMADLFLKGDITGLQGRLDKIADWENYDYARAHAYYSKKLITM